MHCKEAAAFYGALHGSFCYEPIRDAQGNEILYSGEEFGAADKS